MFDHEILVLSNQLQLFPSSFQDINIAETLVAEGLATWKKLDGQDQQQQQQQQEQGKETGDEQVAL